MDQVVKTISPYNLYSIYDLLWPVPLAKIQGTSIIHRHLRPPLRPRLRHHSHLLHLRPLTLSTTGRNGCQ
jgi:hypothetical protein